MLQGVRFAFRVHQVHAWSLLLLVSMQLCSNATVNQRRTHASIPWFG
jgi:hypothetical protein